MHFFKKLYTVVESAVSATVGVLVELYEAFIEKCSSWIARYRHYIEKAEFIDTLENSNPNYVCNPIDEALATKCQTVIDTKMPNGLVHELENLSNEERKEFILELVNSFSEIMGVEIDNIVLFSPHCREDLEILGQYDRETNQIFLNDFFISSLEVPQLTEHVTLTILHELKHARQYNAVMGINNYGYDNTLLESWKYDFAFYVCAYESDEAYRKQALELDTFGWTETKIRINAETL